MSPSFSFHFPVYWGEASKNKRMSTPVRSLDDTEQPHEIVVNI